MKKEKASFSGKQGFKAPNQMLGYPAICWLLYGMFKISVHSHYWDFLTFSLFSWIYEVEFF